MQRLSACTWRDQASSVVLEGVEPPSCGRKASGLLDPRSGVVTLGKLNPRLLDFPDAVELRPGANEKIALRDGDAGAQVAFAGIGHRDTVEQFELRPSRNHEHFARVAHHVNLAVAGGGGGFDLGLAVELRLPDDLAGPRDASKAALVAVQDVEPAVIEQRRGNIGADVPLGEFP